MRRDRLAELNFQERAKKRKEKGGRKRAGGGTGEGRESGFVDGDSPIGILYNAN